MRAHDQRLRDSDFDESRRVLNEANRYIPGGVNTCRRRIDPHFCVRRGRGAYLEDVDGNRFLDYHAAYGAVFLGHSHPVVVRGVKSAIEEGVLFGVGATEAEIHLARKIVEHVPSVEKVLLCGSGSEATFNAIRLARAVTGRSRIIKFQGCYNGAHDYVLRNTSSPRELVGLRDPGSAGMLDAAIDHTLVCRFNELEDVRTTLERNDGQIAAIILEPIPHNVPTLAPQEGFLEGLRRLCDASGALLIFDEIISGFRHDLGGFQALAGVLPDLTALGKALANGFPAAALGGRADLMERFNTTATGDVFYGGTYSGNAVAVAAGLATIAYLEDGSTHKRVFQLGERMRAGLMEVAARAGVAAVVPGYGSLFTLCFMEPPLENYEDTLRNDKALVLTYRQELMRRGIFMMPPSLGRDHISASHTEADIDRTLEVAEASLRAALDRQAKRDARGEPTRE
jgi:glutamate-1-semialdehyde 2,1-aminomutase